MSRLLVPRMLATGWLVGAATAVRVGAGGLELLLRRAPGLVRLGVQASGAGTAVAQTGFRDELLGLTRDGAELVWRELRRGIDDLDAFTRTDNGGPGRRYHRVKL